VSSRTAVALAGGLLGAGAAAAAWKRRSATTTTTTTSGRDDGGGEPQEWQCVCGQKFRVVGEGRHRVFWLPDAPPSEPVLDDRCPNCGRPLHEEPAAASAGG
jgi:hypothetical protein